MTWIKATLIRMVKTGAQAAIAVIGTAALVTDIDFSGLLSIVGVAMLVSVLTSLAGLPEANTPGPLEGKLGGDGGYLHLGRGTHQP